MTSGNWTQEDEEGEAVFAPEPRYLNASTQIVDALKKYKDDRASEILELPAKFTGGGAPKQPVLSFGPVASGAAVIESGNIVDGLMYQNRKLEGQEMESYGFYLACRHGHRSLEYAMIKSVCDRGRPPRRTPRQSR